VPLFRLTAAVKQYRLLFLTLLLLLLRRLLLRRGRASSHCLWF
jgi:hypothetical protein